MSTTSVNNRTATVYIAETAQKKTSGDNGTLYFDWTTEELSEFLRTGKKPRINEPTTYSPKQEKTCN